MNSSIKTAKLYILHGPNLLSESGNVADVFKIGSAALRANPELLLKLYRVRGGDKTARVIACFNKKGFHPIQNGGLFEARGLLDI